MGLLRVEEMTRDDASMVRVPIHGVAVCAGFPSPADDFLEGAIDFPRWLAPNPPATFAFNVSGWSMVGAGVHDRDLAVADRSLPPVHRSVVVAVVDGTISLKRLLIEDGAHRLTFDNPDMPAFAVEEMAEGAIWGVVRFSIRWHVARAGLVR